jgi:hypothetical protein
MEPWRKSSHSGTEEHTCVELAKLDVSVGIRDSVDPDAGHLTSLLRPSRSSSTT